MAPHRAREGRRTRGARHRASPPPPSQLYRGAAGSTRRYFPLKLPVALDGDRALFVYTDPGHDTLTAFSTWTDAHGCLWEALAKRHRSVEVVRTDKEFDRAQAILQRRVRAAGLSEASGDVREELARIERAILRGTPEVLEESGGLQTALKRSVALEKQARSQPARGSIHRGSTWKSVRLSRARFR